MSEAGVFLLKGKDHLCWGIISSFSSAFVGSKTAVAGSHEVPLGGTQGSPYSIVIVCVCVYVEVDLFLVISKSNMRLEPMAPRSSEPHVRCGLVLHVPVFLFLLFFYDFIYS